jgi:hypothetical protein
MPYIEQNQREKINSLIDEMVKKVVQDEELYSKKCGVANYTITRFILGLRPTTGWSYTEINNLIGVLECCKQELYRRLAFLYEDYCIAKNEDVKEYRDAEDEINTKWDQLP